MMKIWILILTFLSAINVAKPLAYALQGNSFQDDARDMLRSETEENENADATSRWGQSVRNHNQAEYKRVTKVTPIAESSFAHESNRAPASQRGPAALPEQQPQVHSDEALPASAMIREAKKNKAYQETAVIANDQGFFPSTVFVTQGIPVRMFVTGASAKSGCFIMDSFGVRRQIRSQRIEEISFTPETPGTYTFTCPMNGARGSVVVKEIDLGTRMPASAQVSQGDGE
ncbi:MAG: cupredoxin domain-containing protein [Bdellovibrionales bacterium]|nr:cupredoxin domain-containing protein [Bdellovibrionales bacterium]